MPAPQTEILITVEGIERGRHFVAPGDYVIGRDADCAICVDADLVSREHAKLILNFDNTLIEDLGSSNGTFVNDAPVTELTRLWPSQKIRIGAVVARGGMGAILDAREAAIKRKVAMKVMLDTDDAGDIARFVAEAQVTGQLEHPNVVPVHELSVDENGQPFYTMKMVRGVTLKKVLDLMAAGTEATIAKYPLAALLTVFEKVCDALAFAHSRGVIHRDLKPENIMIGDFGEVLVMDWGLAKRMKDEGGTMKDGASGNGNPARVAQGGHAPSSIHLAPSPVGATLQGTSMGTPQFMSPEQARGEIEW